MPGNTRSLVRICSIPRRISTARAESGNAVFSGSLHSVRGHRPEARLQVDLVPSCPEHFAGAGSGQDGELKGSRRYAVPFT